MGVPSKQVYQRQNSRGAVIPAAIGGINAIKALPTMGEEECVYTFNLLAEDFGMEVRDGYVEWANGWTGDPARSVITFEGNVNADDRLFVANNEGIWDVTTEGDIAPVQVVVFPDQTDKAGVVSFVNFTNDGNDRFLLVCDGQNGYYLWTQTTDIWLKIIDGGGPGHINGIDPALLNYVMIWKQRVWFIEKESANAWYLPPNVFEGNATQFNFGDQFRFGGALVSLHNWTLDGGNGIDDHLAAISAAGDVIIYQGTDPAQASTFGLVGSWYVGGLPVGNRVATEFAGELYVLSVQGLLPMSKVLKSANIFNPMSYVTAKISPYIRPVMDEVREDFGWHIHIHPKQSLMYVNSPPRAAQEQLAFTFYFGGEAWSMVRGLNKSDTANWRGEVYWTDINRNKIYIQRGFADGVFLDPSTDGEPQGIEWEMLTSYSNFELPAVYKRCQYIRPVFVAGGVPAYEVQAHYDYDLDPILSSPAFTGATNALWNIATWNVGLWEGGLEVTDNPRGANGMGRSLAVALRGISAEATTLAAFDIIYDAGGLL